MASFQESEFIQMNILPDWIKNITNFLSLSHIGDAGGAFLIDIERNTEWFTQIRNAVRFIRK